MPLISAARALSGVCEAGGVPGLAQGWFNASAAGLSAALRPSSPSSPFSESFNNTTVSIQIISVSLT